MSATIGHPPGMGAPPPGMGAPPSNVVPMPMQQLMVPNPAYAQWQKVAQARAMVIAKNAAKQKQFDDAVALIRRDGLTGFRLDIESDSTIALDEAQDRTDRTEFIGALLPLLQQVIPVAQGNPTMAELGKQLVMFGVRGFPVARSLEEGIEQAFDALSGMPPMPPKGAQAKGADPAVEQAKIAADTKNVQTQSQSDMAIAQAKEQTARMAILQKQQAAEGQQRIAELKAQSEQQRSFAELAIQASEAQHRQDMAGHQAAEKAAEGLT